MRELFVVLEQQRVSHDAVQNLGPPDQDRFQQIMKERSIEHKKEQQAKKQQKD